jgi:hypothetical protein
VLNLNVPALPYSETRGLRWGGLAEFGSVRSQIVYQAEGELFFDLVETPYDPPKDSDLGLVNAGFAAVTSLHGTSEVWNAQTLPGQELSLLDAIPAASQQDRLQPAQSVLN